jgi:hypothetical protein
VDACKITEEERLEMLDVLNQTLGMFKIHWTALKPVMMATGAVISGSAALAVLLGGEFVPQDLDIYVNANGFAEMLVFLMDHGYKLVIPRQNYGLTKEYPESTIVLTLKRNGTGEGETRKIDLIGTTERDAHPLTAITQFHSTAAMNYIAFYGIVCLYPEWTMRRNGLVTRRNVPSEILNKYRDRGFNMAYTSAELVKYDSNHNCGEHICCPRMKRHLLDQWSLFVPFNEGDGDIRLYEWKEKEGIQWMLGEVKVCRKTVQ